MVLHIGHTHTFVTGFNLTGTNAISASISSIVQMESILTSHSTSDTHCSILIFSFVIKISYLSLFFCFFFFLHFVLQAISNGTSRLFQPLIFKSKPLSINKLLFDRANMSFFKFTFLSIDQIRHCTNTMMTRSHVIDCGYRFCLLNEHDHIIELL